MKDKCEKKDDETFYCDSFKAMIRKSANLPDCHPIGERN